jgi:hypothetical protein
LGDENMTAVNVIMGGTGGDGCHVEVFADTPQGYDHALARWQRIMAMNDGAWKLKLVRLEVKE